jgi:hypothetical protein
MIFDGAPKTRILSMPDSTEKSSGAQGFARDCLDSHVFPSSACIRIHSASIGILPGGSFREIAESGAREETWSLGAVHRNEVAVGFSYAFISEL